MDAWHDSEYSSISEYDAVLKMRNTVTKFWTKRSIADIW